MTDFNNLNLRELFKIDNRNDINKKINEDLKKTQEIMKKTENAKRDKMKENYRDRRRYADDDDDDDENIKNNYVEIKTSIRNEKFICNNCENIHSNLNELYKVVFSDNQSYLAKKSFENVKKSFYDYCKKNFKTNVDDDVYMVMIINDNILKPEAYIYSILLKENKITFILSFKSYLNSFKDFHLKAQKLKIETDFNEKFLDEVIKNIKDVKQNEQKEFNEAQIVLLKKF